uniref:Uncharacterized protein n=1 Tax=Arundo donax TaxID=35708 RepID=A0A0A9A0L9_ARUDO
MVWILDKATMSNKVC